MIDTASKLYASATHTTSRPACSMATAASALRTGSSPYWSWVERSMAVANTGVTGESSSGGSSLQVRVEESDGAVPCDARRGLVVHRRGVPVRERMPGVVVGHGGIAVACHRPFDGVDLLAGDVGIAVAVVEQDRALDPLRQVQLPVDARAVVADRRVGAAPVH